MEMVNELNEIIEKYEKYGDDMLIKEFLDELCLIRDGIDII